MLDWKKEIRPRLQGLRLAPTREAEIVEELAQHMGDRYEELLANGATKEDAWRTTLEELKQSDLLARELWMVERKVGQEPVVLGARRINIPRDLWQDVRFSLRMLLKSKGFTVVATLSLALGIGANTAIFSVVNAVLLRPLPYNEPERLVHVFRNQPAISRGPISPPDFLDWQARQKVFIDIAGYQTETFNLTGVEHVERLNGVRVSSRFLSLFGMTPARGRFFETADDQAGSDRVTVIGYGLWQRQFGGDPDAVGKTIMLNGEAHAVVGIAPREFQFPRAAEVWTPARLAESAESRGSNSVSVIARLKDEISETQARAQMNQVADVLAQQYPDQHAKLTVSISPLLADDVREIGSVLWILLGAVSVVLMIACANLANLLLGRAFARQKEFAIRLALGASRWRMTRQLLTEGVLLSLMGGALGIGLALWGASLLRAFAPDNIPRVKEIGLDKGVLGFTLLISLLTGIILGLAPAWQSVGRDLNGALKKRARGAGPGGTHQAWLRPALVVAEVALSLVLLVGAGLLIASMHRLLAVNPGFDPANVLAADVSFPHRPASAYPPGNAGEQQHKQELINFLKEAQRRVAALPGVEAVGMMSDLPLTGKEIMNGNFKVEGQTSVNWSDAPNASWHLITPDYFRAIGTPLLKGRVFDERDTTHGPFFIVISDTLASRFFPGADPVGKHLSLLDGRPHEIIGVVGAVRQVGLNLPPDLQIYFSYLQVGFGEEATLVVRTSGDPAPMAEDVRRSLREANPDAPVSRIQTMTQVLADSTVPARFNMVLMVLFALVALALAAIGLYSVISYSVTQRSQEIGIRLALGAQRRDVLKLVVGQGLLLALIGVGIGLVASFALTRLMASLLFGVMPNDGTTLAIVSLGLIAFALLACYIPARRATKVDPLVTLRYE
jgi:predicted permease